MKTKGLIKLLVGITFAASGAFAVGSAVSNKKAESVSAGSATRLYLDMSGFTDWYSSSASFKVHTWNSAQGDRYHAVTKVGNAYYYADVDLSTYANGGGYRFTRYNSTGSSEWNKGAWRSYSDGVATYYRPSDWTDGAWSVDDQKTWTVVGATNGIWAGGDEDISISLTMRFDAEGLEFYNTSVNLTAGSVFKVKNSTNNYYGYDCIETGAGSVIAAGDVSGSGSSNITVVNSGSYEIYMKPFSAKFWMQENSEASATTWATSFLSQTNSICATGGTSANHLSALQGVWSGLKSDFESLTLGARNIVKAGTANSTVADAHDRYIHIMSRYGDQLAKMDNWSASSARIVPVIASNTNNQNIMVIIVISAISVTAIGGFFFIRKRKYN